jgi:DNA-binding transcriptional LysR family regulator
MPASLGYRQLGREKMVFCASPAYLAREGRPESVEALLQHRAIVYERVDGSSKPWQFVTEDGYPDWRTVPYHMALGDADAQLQAVLGGLGVAQMPTWLIRDALARGELERVLPHMQPDGLALTLVWPRRKQLLPKVDALLCALSELDIGT